MMEKLSLEKDLKAKKLNEDVENLNEQKIKEEQNKTNRKT